MDDLFPFWEINKMLAFFFFFFKATISVSALNPLLLWVIHDSFRKKSDLNLLPVESREGEKVSGEVGMLHLMTPVLSHEGLLGGEEPQPAEGSTA